MVTAVDTNILLDILIPNQRHVQSSLNRLERASAEGTIVICEVVFAELASQFRTIGELNAFLNDTRIEVVWSDKDALFKASRFWQEYLAGTPRKGHCPECGKRFKTVCTQCGSEIPVPRRVLNDFVVGAHSLSFADVLLTRDRGFYREYFSDIRLR